MPDPHPSDVLPIRVRILDREYPLKVRAEKEALMRALAEQVNTRLVRLKRQIPNQPDLTLTVLATLQLAEELNAREHDLENLRASVEAEAEALVARLDAALPDAT
ncbi:MAG: cell division protein ZapA [Bacteroidota bacterium]